MYNALDTVFSNDASLIVLHSITYNANSATGAVPVDTNGYASGSTVTIKSNSDVIGGTPVSKTGHIFSGWSTNSTGSAKSYRGDGTDTLKMPLAPLTLYAKWVIDTFTVTFISTGTTIFQTQRIAYNGQATLPATQPVLAGSAFEGWFTTNDISGVSFDFSSPITANRTLYARWASVYSVLYQANGGTGSVPTDSKKYKNGEPATVLGNTGGLTKANNDFAGWTLNEQGTGTVVNAGDQVTVGSGDFNLFAKWRSMCTVTFDGQSATITPSPATSRLEISTAIGTLPTDPKKTSYAFDGWYRNLSDSSTKITTASTFSGNTTVYAKWVIKDADGNIYTEVKIGNQVWMVENLKTTKYRDDIPIPYVTDSTQWVDRKSAAYCWYNNIPGQYKDIFGASYNWYVVAPNNPQKIAPEGWHVPSAEEWDVLRTYCGDSAAVKLKKDTSLWSGNYSATNITGFSAFPSAMRFDKFLDMSSVAAWWSTDEYDSEHGRCAWIWFYLNELYDSTRGKADGMSIRCIRD